MTYLQKLIHEREAHAETQAALREFIADLDRANAALILAKEALSRLRDCDWVITPADRMDAVRDIAAAAIDAIDKVGVVE